MIKRKELFKMKLNTKILCCRTNSGLTKEQFSEKLGISCETLHSWETGESEPTVNELIHIANTMGVSADWLLLDRLPPEQPAKNSSPSNSAEGILEKITSAAERLFKKHGWISGIFVSLFGLYRVLSVIFASITAASSIPSFALTDGMFVGIYGLYVVQALTGVAIIIGGIVMTIKLKKWCKSNSEE